MSTPDEIWKKFLERDAYLDKLQEDRANFWISQSGDPAREKVAIERIEKELNPEIDKVAAEVKELLEAFNKMKGGADISAIDEGDDALDDEADINDEDAEDDGQEGNNSQDGE